MHKPCLVYVMDNEYWCLKCGVPSEAQVEDLLTDRETWEDEDIEDQKRTPGSLLDSDSDSDSDGTFHLDVGYFDEESSNNEDEEESTDNEDEEALIRPISEDQVVSENKEDADNKWCL